MSPEQFGPHVLMNIHELHRDNFATLAQPIATRCWEDVFSAYQAAETGSPPWAVAEPEGYKTVMQDSFANRHRVTGYIYIYIKMKGVKLSKTISRLTFGSTFL